MGPAIAADGAIEAAVDGFNVDGFNVDGFNVDGFNVDGFNRAVGIARDAAAHPAALLAPSAPTS